MSKIDVSNLYTVGESVTLNQLTTLLGMTSNKIKGFIALGLPHVVNGHTTVFDTVATVRWIVSHEVNQAMNLDEEFMSGMEAKRRGEVAKALMAELQLAKEREQLANIEDLMMNFTSALIQVRAKLVSQPSRLSGILSHQDQKEINRLLEADSQEMLEVLSEYKHEYTGNESRSTTENIRVDNPRIPPMPKAAPKT